MKKIFLILLFFNAHAESLKDTFVSAVVKECGKSMEDALALATPGRAGNVVKYKLCPQTPVEITDDCKLNCSASAGNVVGN